MTTGTAFPMLNQLSCMMFSYFNVNTEEGLFKASHWTNLRMYPTNKNSRKGNRIPTKEEITENNKLISSFLKLKNAL